MNRSIPDWEPLSESVLADQRRAYDRQRAACPVARSTRGVTLFRHADVVAAAADPQAYSSAASAFRQVPNSLDPPDHTPYRTTIDAYFTPTRMAALEPQLQAVAEVIVATLPRDVTFDAVADFGQAYAVRAQCEWLGWHGIESRLLAWMAENHAATRSNDRARIAASADAFDDLVAAQLRRRRELGDAAPADPTTDLLRVVVGGRPLPDADLVSILRNWTAGDLASIAAAVGVVAQFLATHPEEQARLRAHAHDLPAAIDEMLRIDDPFLASRRVTTRAVAVGGYPLEAGTHVYLNWTSANRDEAVFPDPDAYRPREHAPHNLVYGTGIHVCPGRPLATLELVVAVRALFAASARIEPGTDAEPVREAYPLGGYRRLPIRLT